MIRINGTPVIELSIYLPLSGIWSADLHCEEVTPFAVGSKVTIALPGLNLVGLVDRCAAYSSRLHVKVLGGASVWAEQVTAKNYSNVSADQLVKEIGVFTDKPIGKTFSFWSRIDSTKGITMQTIAKQLGVNWRANPDSSIRIRAEDFATVKPDAVETYRDESGGMIELAIENAVVVPGTKVKDDLVGDVTYTLQESGRLVCRYWTEGRGRLLERYVKGVMRDVLYLGTYSATVQAQASDGSLDLTPDDGRLKGTGLQKVPLRHGLPGCEVKVKSGARIYLAFDGGDPTKPYASLWYPGDVTEINLGGSLKVALADLVKNEMSRIASVFDGHTHVLALSAGTGTAAPPAAPMSPIADVASKVLGSS